MSSRSQLNVSDSPAAAINGSPCSGTKLPCISTAAISSGSDQKYRRGHPVCSPLSLLR